MQADEQEAQSPEWESIRPGTGRPKWLSALTIAAIVLGSLFGCCGIAGIGSMVAGQAMNPAIMQQSQGNPQVDTVQKRYFERTAAFQKKIFPLSLTSGLLGLLHAFGLITAGVLAYRASELGRRLLVGLCFAGIAVELVSGYVGLYTANEQSAMMAPMMEELAQAPQGADAQQDEQARRTMQASRGVMSMALKAGSVFGWLTIIGFFLVKSGFYIGCALYLRRAEVVQFFQRVQSEPQTADATG